MSVHWFIFVPYWQMLSSTAGLYRPHVSVAQQRQPHWNRQALGLTLLAPLLLGSVDVVFELDADLPLVGLVPDEGVLQQLLSGRTLGVILHQAALDKAEELLRPVRIELNVMFEVDTTCSVTSLCVDMRDALTERIRIKLTIFWTWVEEEGFWEWGRGLSLDACHTELEETNGEDRWEINESQKHISKSYMFAFVSHRLLAWKCVFYSLHYLPIPQTLRALQLYVQKLKAEKKNCDSSNHNNF